MKPIAGPPRIARVAARIRTEEILLELMAKELPDHRIDLFNRIAPYLRFRLSDGFNIAKLPDMPYTGPRTAAMQLEETERLLKKQEAADDLPEATLQEIADIIAPPSRFEQLGGKTMMLRGHAETSFEPAEPRDLGALADAVETICAGVDDQAPGVPGDGKMLAKLERHVLSRGMTLEEAAERVGKQLTERVERECERAERQALGLPPKVQDLAP